MNGNLTQTHPLKYKQCEPDDDRAGYCYKHTYHTLCQCPLKTVQYDNEWILHIPDPEEHKTVNG